MNNNWSPVDEGEIRLCKAVGEQFSLGDIVLDTHSMQFGVVKSISIPVLSFQSNPHKKRPKQIKARIVDCLYMGSLWVDVWPKLADYGIRDPRITLTAANKWIDQYKAVLTAYSAWRDKEYSVTTTKLHYSLERLDVLTDACKAAGLWDETHQSLFEFVGLVRAHFQEYLDYERMDYEESEEYQLRVQDTY